MAMAAAEVAFIRLLSLCHHHHHSHLCSLARVALRGLVLARSDDAIEDHTMVQRSAPRYVFAHPGDFWLRISTSFFLLPPLFITGDGLKFGSRASVLRAQSHASVR